MRKLIIVGIIFVVAMITWIGYVKYDTQQFIKELPSPPDASSPPGQTQATVKDDSVTVTGNTIESTTGPEKASPLPTEDLPAGISEDVAYPDRLRTNTETGGDVLESGQTPADTELAPEVVALYTDLQPLYYEYAKVGAEYIQAMTKMLEIVNQKKEITEKLNATSAPETAQELGVERKKLQTWIDANYSNYKALRDETYRRTDAMQTLVESRGFSYRSFDWNAFFMWRGKLQR